MLPRPPLGPHETLISLVPQTRPNARPHEPQSRPTAFRIGNNLGSKKDNACTTSPYDETPALAKVEVEGSNPFARSSFSTA